MDSTFNPYLKWLGIPLKHQPPTHYRLLGVEQFETDADIIERAADRQMTYLRSLQSGENGKAAQQLLNEIAAAKVCLLDPKRRVEYDAKLRPASSSIASESNIAVASANGSGIHAADGGGEVALASPALPKPARRVPAPGNSAILTAKPLPAAPRPKEQNSNSSSSASGIVLAARPSAPAKPVAAADSESAPKSMLPLVLAAAAAAAFLLVATGVAAFALMSSGEPETVAVNHTGTNDATAGTAGDDSTTQAGANNTGGNTTSTTGTNHTENTSGGNGNPLPAGENDLAGIESENPFADPATSTETDESDDATPPPGVGANVQIEAPFQVGTVDIGEPVLQDRDFIFTNVDTALQGLDFTSWKFGAVEPFKVNIKQSGDLFLILPPDQYARKLPRVQVTDFEETTLTCDVLLPGRRVLACRVLRYSGKPVKQLTINGSSSIWPIVAVSTINRQPRPIGEVAVVEPPREHPVVIPPPRGGNEEDDPPAVDDEPPPQQPTKVASKQKVPSTELQKPVREKLAQLYELDALKTPEDKLRVAKNLLDVAKEPSDKPEERYVMMATGAQLAADAGDLVSALEAVDLLAADYDGDTSAMKLHLARMFAKSSVTANVKAQQLAHVLPVIDEGLANDHFDAIDDLVKELLAARLRHPELAGRRKIALDMKDTYRKVVSARKTLATNPDDPAANQVIGEYFCYYKLDWEQGLPHLAKGEAGALKEAAGGDASNPETGKDQLAVADKWYNIAKDLDVKSDERQKGSLLARAQEWYEKASSDLEGLDEAHAKKRLDEVKDELVKMGWVDIPRQATIVAASGYGFQCYLNGERLFSGSYGVESTTATLKRGDVLMFHATKSSGSFGSYGKGFACVIAYEGNSAPVATGLTKGWEGYVPANQLDWYRPDGIASTTPILASSGSGHQDLVLQTGVGARSIWYAAANLSEAYFVYRVR